MLRANPADRRVEVNTKPVEKKIEPVKLQEGKLLELSKRPKVEVDRVKAIEEAIKEPEEEAPKEVKTTLGDRLKTKNPALRFSDTESSGDDEEKATKTVDAILAKENKAKIANDSKPQEQKKDMVPPKIKPSTSAPLALLKKNSTFDSASLFSKPKPKPTIPEPTTSTKNFEFKRVETSSPKNKPAELFTKPGHKRSMTMFGSQTKDGNDLLSKAAAAKIFTK